ncbi:MAG TPA: N-acetylmuramoyl-L-alanine amidase [Streptosporangiaceae bacterium]
MAVGDRLTRITWAVVLSLAVGAGSSACTIVSPPPAGATPAATKSSHDSRNPSPSHTPSASHSHRPSQPAKPLAGKVIGIDPGHNGLNHTDPAYLNHLIWNGRERETCDTTGTQTASGYSEALFNFSVALYLRADLRKDGASVVMTRQNNDGLGPCVDKRSRIINAAHADVAIDIHADGGPVSGRGFTVLEPIPDGPNDGVISSSMRLGSYVHEAFLADTPFGVSDYYGHDGYIRRNDLAGLNLTTVPKVLIECGNMPNPADAALLTSAKVQKEIARALEAAIIRFLTGRWPAGTG